MQRTTTTLILGALAALCSPVMAGDTWYDDFDAATEVAKKEGKDLFVDFTGSDWCGWCVRLHDEVFGFEDFLTAVQKDFVLVALDYPRGDEAKAKVPNPERNDELSEKYNIQGFPTVLLMNADGEVFASTGYRQGGVEPYLAHVAEISATGREALAGTKKIVAEFAAAEGDAKLAAWEKAIALLAKLDGDSPFAPQLAPTVRWAYEVDPKNESGLQLRAVEALMKAGQAEKADLEMARNLDPKNEKGLLEQVVEAQFMKVRDDVTAKAALEALDGLMPLGFKDTERAFMLQFRAATWCAGPLDDLERAKKYAASAKEVGTEEEGMMEALEEILGS